MSRADRDREQALREAHQQLAKFARDLTAGRTGMLDRFGAKVEAGDYVLYRPQHDLIFEVKAVKPNMDPRVPIGTVILVLEAQTDVQFFASTRAMTVIKCGTTAKDEVGKTDITAPGTTTPHEFPTGDPGDPDAEARAAEPPTDLPAPGEPPSQVDEPPLEDQKPETEDPTA